MLLLVLLLLLLLPLLLAVDSGCLLLDAAVGCAECWRQRRPDCHA